MKVDGVTVVRNAPAAEDQDYQVFIEGLVRDARFDVPLDLSAETAKLRSILVQEQLGQQALNVSNAQPSVIRGLSDLDAEHALPASP
jgi:hypothetical protein